MPERLSMRAYGRHRKAQGLPGTSHVAVSKAIQDGRIAEAVDDEGLIDPEVADRLWADRTRAFMPTPDSRPVGGAASNGSGKRAPAPAPAARPVEPPAAEASPGATPEPSAAERYNQARARHEAAKAAQAELDLLERQGKLVPLEVHERRVAELAARFRSHLDAIPGAWPSRLARCGGDVEELQLMCRTLVRETLHAVVAGPADG